MIVSELKQFLGLFIADGKGGVGHRLGCPDLAGVAAWTFSRRPEVRTDPCRHAELVTEDRTFRDETRATSKPATPQERQRTQEREENKVDGYVRVGTWYFGEWGWHSH